MKDIKTFINEAANTEYYFLPKTSPRSEDDFKFTVGDKCILLRYDTDGYGIQIRESVKVTKVLKNRTVVTYLDDNGYDEWDLNWIKNLKFDRTGIYVEKEKNKYRGNSTVYWVLWNKELIDAETEIKGLLNGKASEWGFHKLTDERKKNLEKKIEEIEK